MSVAEEVTSVREAHRKAGTKNSADLVRRQPPLRLVGIRGGTFQVISPEHPTYLLAAFAWHHSSELSEPARRALFSVLAGQWPRVQGQRPQRADDAYAVFAVKDFGASQGDIAEAWVIEDNSAAKKLRRGRRLLEQTGGNHDPRVEIATERAVAEAEVTGRKVDCLSEPLDPAELCALDAVDRDELRGAHERLTDASQRAQRRALEGAQAVRLLITPPDGKPISMDIPTADPERAMAMIEEATEGHDSPYFLYAGDVPINPATMLSTLRNLRPGA